MTGTLQKNYYPGLDILKYCLAIIIVQGHCSLLSNYSWSIFFSPIESSAIPTFFAVSSFLFFKKVNNSPSNQIASIVKHSILRLLILFAVWYLLMLPLTYHTFFKIATWKEIVYSFFLSCSFRGYWFIKALIINMLILYLCRKRKQLIWCSIISALLLLTIIFISKFRTYSFQPYYSFYYHTFSFCTGALICRYQSLLPSRRTLFFFLVLSYFSYFIPTFGNNILRLICPFIIIPICIDMNLSHSYKTLRNMSILYYMMHFSVIYAFNAFNDITSLDNLFKGLLSLESLRFITVFIVITIISFLIIRGEKKPKFSFLRYLH